MPDDLIGTVKAELADVKAASDDPLALALELIDIVQTEDPEMGDDFRNALFVVAASVQRLLQADKTHRDWLRALVERCEQAEALREENRRLYTEDRRIFAELQRTLEALSGQDDASQAVQQLGPTEYCADLAKRRMADLTALREHMQNIGDMVSGDVRLTDPHDIVPAVAELVGLRERCEQAEAQLSSTRADLHLTLKTAATQQDEIDALRSRHEAVGACEHCDHRIAEIAALRSRHAEAVEAAFRAGYSAGGDDMSAAHHNEYYIGEDDAWAASEARKAVARDE